MPARPEPHTVTVTESNLDSLDSLMARLADGDRSVFRAVFEQLWPPTLRLCSSMLKNDADAADAAQQAMTKMLERASDYDPTRPALPWALAIAGWECRTILRTRSRRRETAADLAPEPARAEDTEQDLAMHELVTLAREAIGQLSDIDRGVLETTFLEEAPRGMGGALAVDAGAATEARMHQGTQGATIRKRRERAIVRLRAAFRRLYGID
jgi:RNA polymerase sigma-70 factor, ECF subfamily